MPMNLKNYPCLIKRKNFLWESPFLKKLCYYSFSSFDFRGPVKFLCGKRELIGIEHDFLLYKLYYKTAPISGSTYKKLEVISPSLITRKNRENWKSTTLPRSIRKLKTQGRAQLWILKKKTNMENHSSVRAEATTGA